MPLRDDLLNPISEANPGGENLRYAPVYDKIKEARREEDDAPQGEWQRERKVADWAVVIKMASEAIALKSKDVQLAAWLTEALLNREGFGGLNSGLGLLRGLVERFWDNLYPEMEDGDLELRAAPLEWVGTKLDLAVKKTPLTRGGHSFLKYKESKTVPSEEDAGGNEAKSEARQAAISDGKTTPEEFEKAFASSPKTYYQQLVGDLDACLETIESLGSLCDEKFGEFTPSFSRLREVLEEVRHTANSFLQKKRELEPDEQTAVAEEPVEEEAVAAEGAVSVSGGAAAAAKPARKLTSAEPVDKDDAIGRVIAVAAYLRREDPYGPAPYLLLRALRWGELRAAGSSIDANLLEPPSTGIRQQLKKLANDGSWEEVLAAAENAMAMSCGRGWLDLQRYAVRACENLGSYYDPIATAIRSELRALLRDFADLPSLTMLDDTPTANPETQAWLEELRARDTQEGAVAAPSMDEVEREAAAGGEQAPDTFTIAMDAARSGRRQDAIELMSGEIARQTSGRGRFQRKLQLAQLCISIGHDAIARSILEELLRSIERHQLEEWESPEVIAHALGMLYRCLQKLDGDPVEAQKLYARICRLDPMQALAHAG
ncbi:MAG: type VI secretion system protein TssA [Acidobacteria bacterium]|nr:type VI secretion system protein TssA [Acidobacteriota bacterium]